MSNSKGSAAAKLGPDDIKRIAQLARLELDQRAIPEFTANFVGTLEWISKLQKVDIADIEETSQVTGLSNVFRPDQIKPSLNRETFLRDAPAREGDQLKVSAIFAE